MLNGLAANSAEIIKLDTKDYIEDLDLLLRVLYSIILDNSEGILNGSKPLFQVTTIYVPDLLAFFGKDKSSRNETLSIIKNIMRFHNDYLFYTDHYIRSQAFTKRLNCICKIIGIKHRLLHKLRKTYATRLINTGVDKTLVKS